MPSKAEEMLDRHTKDKVGRGRFPKRGVLMAVKEISSLAFEEGFNACLKEIGIDNLNNPIYRQMRDLCKEQFIDNLFNNE